jgi:hypothetical protein
VSVNFGLTTKWVRCFVRITKSRILFQKCRQWSTDYPGGGGGRGHSFFFSLPLIYVVKCSCHPDGRILSLKYTVRACWGGCECWRCKKKNEIFKVRNGSEVKDEISSKTLMNTTNQKEHSVKKEEENTERQVGVELNSVLLLYFEDETNFGHCVSKLASLLQKDFVVLSVGEENECEIRNN